MATVRYTGATGRLFAEKRGGARKAYRTDALGSTVSLYDNSQAKTDTFTYWPYGEDRVVSNPTGTKNRFVGGYQCRTQIDGSIYMRARVEEPRDGRFMTVDPLWPLEVPYSYGLASPSSRSDPSGLSPIRQSCSQNQLDVLKVGRDYICAHFTGGIGPATSIGELLACVKSKMSKGCQNYAPPVEKLKNLSSCLNFFCAADYRSWFSCSIISGCENRCAITECQPATAGFPDEMNICPDSFECKDGKPIGIIKKCTPEGKPYGIPCMLGKSGSSSTMMILHELIHGCAVCDDSKCGEQFTQALTCCMMESVK